MATHNLDGDQEFVVCFLGGVQFHLGDVLSPTQREKIKHQIKGIDQKNMRDERIKIAIKVLWESNDSTYFDEDKVTDAELVQFAVLVSKVVWG